MWKNLDYKLQVFLFMKRVICDVCDKRPDDYDETIFFKYNFLVIVKDCILLINEFDSLWSVNIHIR